MLEILSAAFGFLAPFTTEVVKIFQKKQDQKHELAMMEIQIRAAAQQHLYKMEELNANADISEAVELHKPQQSFGVQLLDAAKNHSMNSWTIIPAFYMFVVLDFVAGLVRPSITYAAFAFYATVKWAQFEVAKTVSTTSVEAILSIWGEPDRAIVILVLSYWFGHRAAKAAFGGSANTAYKGT